MNSNVIASGGISASKSTTERKAIHIGKPVDINELKRIPSVLRSKYSFYIDPPNQVVEAQNSSKQRLKLIKRKQIMEREQEIKQIQDSNSLFTASILSMNAEKNKKLTLQETEQMIRFEKERHARLIGQLKAAEARNRTRILKMRYFHCKQDEIDRLIESQPNAIKSVRLEAFLPAVPPEKVKVQQNLTPIERRRLEIIVDDSKNTTIERKLY